MANHLVAVSGAAVSVNGSTDRTEEIIGNCERLYGQMFCPSKSNKYRAFNK